MTEFLLLRHGESTWNAEHRWQGQSDPPLTRRGEQQARDAVASLVELGPFDAVVASNLQRARRTGELLAQGASLELGRPSQRWRNGMPVLGRGSPPTRSNSDTPATSLPVVGLTATRATARLSSVSAARSLRLPSDIRAAECSWSRTAA